MRFEWDPAKNAVNWAKHRVEFEAAARVFEDENYVLLKDRVIDGEQRWHAIGQIVFPEDGAVLLLVVHVYRETIDGEEIIHILSARKTDKRERRLYCEKALE